MIIFQWVCIVRIGNLWWSTLEMDDILMQVIEIIQLVDMEKHV